MLAKVVPPSALMVPEKAKIAPEQDTDKFVHTTSCRAKEAGFCPPAGPRKLIVIVAPPLRVTLWCHVLRNSRGGAQGPPRGPIIWGLRLSDRSRCRSRTPGCGASITDESCFTAEWLSVQRLSVFDCTARKLSKSPAFWFLLLPAVSEYFVVLLCS